jgi:hypothetical protein
MRRRSAEPFFLALHQKTHLRLLLSQKTIFFREPERILFRLFCMKGTRDVFTGCR